MSSKPKKRSTRSNTSTSTEEKSSAEILASSQSEEDSSTTLEEAKPVATDNGPMNGNEMDAPPVKNSQSVVNVNGSDIHDGNEFMDVKIVLHSIDVAQRNDSNNADGKEHNENEKENEEGKEDNDDEVNDKDVNSLLVESEFDPPPDTEEPELKVISAEDSEQDTDFDKDTDSPLLRSVTRRSHTRYVPTPKTPDQNGENDLKLPDLPEKVDDDKDVKEPVDLQQDDDSADFNGFDIENGRRDLYSEASFESTQSDTQPDFTNASIVANCTSTNRNDTMMLNDEEISISFKDPYNSPLLNKDVPYTRAIRGLSARRTIRGASVERASKSMLESKEEKPIEPLREFTRTIETHGLKRKYRRSSTPEVKRPKTEESGLLGYLSSPLNSLKSRFVRDDIPSSTPKGTMQRYPYQLLTNDEEKEENKWCTIM